MFNEETGISSKIREAVFQVKSLTKVYTMGEVKAHALRGIDLDLYSGEVVVMLGPSGSGKSTLLNIIGGLILLLADRLPTMGKTLPQLLNRNSPNTGGFMLALCFSSTI